jgi:hypothetical protein
MQKITAAITAVGGYVPEFRLTNAILETMIDTNDEWIRTRTGITERRILKGAGLATSDMVVPAVKVEGKFVVDTLNGVKPEGSTIAPETSLNTIDQPAFISTSCR